MSKQIETTFTCDICGKQKKEEDRYLPEFWSRINIEEFNNERSFPGGRDIDILYICPECKVKEDKVKETYITRIKRWLCQ